jgi:hypothetical protein
MVGVLAVGGLVAYDISRDGGSGHANLSVSTTGHPAGSAASSAPLNRTSEELTLATSQSFNGKLEETILNREAIKFGSTSPSIQYLESESTAVNPDGQQNTTNTGGTRVFVDGALYGQLASGKWIATKSPGLNAEIDDTNRLATMSNFRQAAIGPIVGLGHSVIGGITTTEYRSTISLLKLDYLGQQRGTGFLGSLFGAVDPAPEGLALSLPIEIWVDANGNIIRASA